MSLLWHSSSYLDLDDRRNCRYSAEYRLHLSTSVRLGANSWPMTGTRRTFCPHIVPNHVMSYCSLDFLDRNRHQDSNESNRPMCESEWEKLMSSENWHHVFLQMATVHRDLVHCWGETAHTVVAEATNFCPAYSAGAVHLANATINWKRKWKSCFRIWFLATAKSYPWIMHFVVFHIDVGLLINANQIKNGFETFRSFPGWRQPNGPFVQTPNIRHNIQFFT